MLELISSYLSPIECLSVAKNYFELVSFEYSGHVMISKVTE